MPDIWTFNQEKVKNALTAKGAICQIEPRVIQNRDPNWTCHLDLKQTSADGIIGYDIYIHDANEFHLSSSAQSLFILIFISGLLSGYLIKATLPVRKK